MNDIIFSYNQTRCHARKVDRLPEGMRYIGELDGNEIYQIPNGGWFDQFGFVAIRK